MLRRLAFVAAGCCFAIGLLMFAAEAAPREGHVGGEHFGGGGGFGGGHFAGPPSRIGSTAPPSIRSFGGAPAGGIGSTAPPSLRDFGGGPFAAPRLTAPQFHGLAGGQFGIPSIPPGFESLQEQRARGERFGGARASQFAGRERIGRGTARARQFTGPNARSERFGRKAIAAPRGGQAFAQRGPANSAFARPGPATRAIATRGPMNSTAFRRGNVFETKAFGGHRWRGRYGRFRHFWAGGIFWPYLFGDYVSYAFWPNEWENTFWAYGPGAILWGAFWPYAGYGEDVYAANAYATGELGAGPGGSEQMAAMCGGLAPGVTGLPLQRLEQIIKPTPEQQAALDELRAAAVKASQILQTACPEQMPVTPVARLDAMEQRLEAMQQAVTIIRGPLERLYALLTDAQIQRLENASAKPGRSQRSPSMDIAQLCSSQSGVTNVPADAIAQTIKLTEEQQYLLDRLKQASDKAAGVLQQSCPQDVARTLTARLDEAKRRIAALIQAIETVRPAVGSFYASLSDQQKSALSSQMQSSRSARR